MDTYAFYSGNMLNAQDDLGAHPVGDGTMFRVYAPGAASVGVIGEFSGWKEIPMQRVEDGRFHACFIAGAKPGMMYKLRIHERSGRVTERSDPYGFGQELRPQYASIIRDTNSYVFGDAEWMAKRTDGRDRPVNIYEVHLGSWRDIPEGEPLTYRSIAPALADHLLENGFNYLELMPLCEYPCDQSWGYQALGFFCPTSRYGSMDDLKYLVDFCHQRGIGVLLDFAPVHFAVDAFGLSEFDGTALYEYPSRDIAYNEWGSKNFNHSRGEVRSFLQSAAFYWLRDYHFDGIRIDAVKNLIYWQGDPARGENRGALDFLRGMNEGIKRALPSVMLIAEDSSTYPKLTQPVWAGGLGFDYKWDMGWMNDTLQYFRENTAERQRDYHKLTFSMHYFYSERFLLPLSHDETVHGKATILQKMNGDYENKFPQARALYLYMYTHPGKKLTFMGNEFGQLREWDETRGQDFGLLRYPLHDSFRCFIRALNHCYLTHPALYAWDDRPEGFRWLDCRGGGSCLYAFLRTDGEETLLAVFQLGDQDVPGYTLELAPFARVIPLLSSDWQRYDGPTPESHDPIALEHGKLTLDLTPFSARLFRLLGSNTSCPDGQ